MNGQLAEDIQAYCRANPDLRNDGYGGEENSLAGHCYVASEAYHHLSEHETTPCYTVHEGVSHWYLRDSEGRVIDLTAEQFAVEPEYSPQSDGKGFCTRDPSARAARVIDAVA